MALCGSQDRFRVSHLTPLGVAVKTTEKHLVPFVLLLALTWVFLRLGMEVFAR